MVRRGVRKNKLFYFILLVLALSIFVLVYVLLNVDDGVLEKKEISASLTVSNKTGFNVSKTDLSFGTLKKGNAAERDDINVTNYYDNPIIVDIIVEGNISQFLNYDTNIYLEPGQTEVLRFSTKIIGDESEGFYDGRVIIFFRKVPKV